MYLVNPRSSLDVKFMKQLN